MSDPSDLIGEGRARAPGHWKRPILLGAVIVFVTLVFYLPAFDAGFIWDDDRFLTLNPLIQARDGLRRFWFTTQADDYFPLTSTTLWIEWRLWHLNAAGYHAVNIALHALSAVLVWRVLKRLRIPGAWLAGLIFGVHPVTVASVAWIAERKNALAMPLYLLSLLAYLRFDETASAKVGTCEGEKNDARNFRRPPAFPPSHLPTFPPSHLPTFPPSHFLTYLLSLALFLLALLSKTSVVMLPVVLLLCIWWRRTRVTRKDFLRAAPFFAVAAALGLVGMWFHAHRVLPDVIARPEGFFSRLAGAGWAAWFYLSKALLPWNLAMIYPRWHVDARAAVSYLPGLALLAFLALAWRSRRSWGRPALFAAGYFVASLFPVLGFFDISFMRYSLVADHWQYVAILGVIAPAAAAGVWARDRLRASRTAGVLAAAVLVAALGVLTWRQCSRYETEETLWRDTLSKNPASWAAHSRLGDVLLSQSKFRAAIGQYEAAIQLDRNAIEPHYNLANVCFALGEAFLQKGRRAEAAGYYRIAVEEYGKVLGIRAGYADARQRLNDARARLGSATEK